MNERSWCDRCDKDDDMFPYQEVIADRHYLKVDSLRTSDMDDMDQFWPPLISIQLWSYYSIVRATRREERLIRKLHFQILLLTLAAGIFWVVYGADQVLR